MRVEYNFGVVRGGLLMTIIEPMRKESNVMRRGVGGGGKKLPVFLNF